MKHLFTATLVISAFGGLIPWNFLGRAIQIGCAATLVMCIIGFIVWSLYQSEE